MQSPSTTPGDGAGDPVNQLDPGIQLFNTTGAPVPHTTVVGNELFTHTATADGTYHVRVFGENGTEGEYLLRVSGNHGDPSDFQVVGASPMDGSITARIPVAVTIDFGDHVIATALAPAAGQDAVLQTAPVEAAGIYTVTVFGGKTPNGAQVLYAIDRESDRVFQIDPTDGSSRLVGPIGFDASFSGLSADEGALYASDIDAATLDFSLAVIDTTAGDSLLVGSHGTSDDIHALAHVDGVLYGFDGIFEAPSDDPTIGIIDQNTGRYTTLFATLVGDPPVPISIRAADFDHGEETLFGIGHDNRLYTIDIASETTTLVGAIIDAAGTPIRFNFSAGLAWNPDPGDEQLYAVGDDNTSGADTLYRIDKFTGIATAVGVTALGRADALEFVGTSQGSYTVQVVLNAAEEDEEHAQPRNDGPATAQSIDASFIRLTGGAAQRGAVLGSLETNPTDTPPIDGEDFEDLVVEYCLDDSTADTSLGFSGIGMDVMWLNAFTVQPGGSMINLISTAWGDSVEVGTPVTVAIYNDPNNDGIPGVSGDLINPGNADLLRLVATTVQYPGNNIFQEIPITPTPVNGVFFVAVIIQIPATGGYPAPIDMSSAQGNSWWAQALPGTFDVNNLSRVGSSWP